LLNWYINLSDGSEILKMKKIYRKIFLSVFLMAGISAVFGSGFFGTVHQYTKITITEFLTGGYLWLIILFSLAGGWLVSYLKLTPAARGLLTAGIFLLLVFVPQLFPVRCTYMPPYPLCLILKPVVFLQKGYTLYPVKFTVTLYALFMLTIVGNKLFCGWACPVGLIQEAVHSLPLKRKQFKIPFLYSNTFRVVLFVVLIILLLAAGVNVFFTYLNPFGPLRWKWDGDFLLISGIIVLAVTVGGSFFVYRPYCYLVCPFGLLTWLLEPFSLGRIRFKKSACTMCRDCITETFCPAVESILEEKLVRPDCFSCGACIEKCPAEALSFGVRER
jgi:ferredoxin